MTSVSKSISFPRTCIDKHIYIHVCIFKYIHTHRNTCTHTKTCLNKSTHTLSGTLLSWHIQRYNNNHMFIHTDAKTNKETHTHTPKHTETHEHIQTHRVTHRHTISPSNPALQTQPETGSQATAPAPHPHSWEHLEPHLPPEHAEVTIELMFTQIKYSSLRV